MENIKINNCRVCGLRQEDAPWGPDGKIPTHEICDCCGVEFGYEDSSVKSALNYRNEWLKEGARWFRPKAKPSNWNLEKQLTCIPNAFREAQYV